MAYNTLSGTVEFAGANGSLENTVRTDDSIQTIDGRKTFLQRITLNFLSDMQAEDMMGYYYIITWMRT